ncbi:class I SAM-dependent methyltransferase [Janthinobacterium violaceinigrum]|uniref:Methyltransferase domain-containing protein n=1 Tax=Janthinobacterium violaceinigrum TaxID=2654252 RepID=A0A6I1I371_9BURK|nr:methyltransferase domain-containing protein [Janthinobacterium violaceinigrum]KAB8064039.1 methyltransferase domain-containing protein [Janthinobacterium violaceinigrum]
MTQNIYDNDAFFTAYSQLPRSVGGLGSAPEWPALRAMLPALHGKNVLDLGCGYGWFCRWAAEAGASRVLGVDVSEKMLAQAGGMGEHPAVSYARMDLEQLAVAPAAYDLVYSSLAFHYIDNFAALLAAIRHGLKRGGKLVFSIEHPIFMAPRQPGWLTDAQGRKRWPVDSYQQQGPRVSDWLAPGVIKQHRTMGTTINALLQAGFQLEHVEEWGPSDEQVALQPALAEERERPMLLLIGCGLA